MRLFSSCPQLSPRPASGTPHRQLQRIRHPRNDAPGDHPAQSTDPNFPDFPAPIHIKQAALDAINADHNQYPITWGVKPFREAIAQKYARTYGMDIDPEREITVCCGATEGMIASLLAVTNPGDEIVVFTWKMERLIRP